MNIDDRIRHDEHLVRQLALGFPLRFRHELHAAGLVALWRAHERYDERRGVKFRTFAARFIRGAMLEELRSFLNGQKRGKAPRLVFTGGRLDVASEDAPDALELGERVDAVMARFPARAAQVIRGVDLDGLTLRECGELMGVGESWVCTLRKRAFRAIGGSAPDTRTGRRWRRRA